jgi:hypothetical protein
MVLRGGVTAPEGTLMNSIAKSLCDREHSEPQRSHRTKSEFPQGSKACGQRRLRNFRTQGKRGTLFQNGIDYGEAPSSQNRACMGHPGEESSSYPHNEHRVVRGIQLTHLANHGSPWRHSRILRRCDTGRRCRSGDRKRGRRRVF